ncbi:MAG: hypothetical protein LBT09_12435, partial [Planctomycetaceae bacterium]|nr:hypothetical protein [Planctomycetaceae bacterium]
MIFLLFVGDPSVPNLHQPDFYLNNCQPAQPPGGRIAHQRMVIRIANKFQAKSAEIGSRDDCDPVGSRASRLHRFWTTIGIG